MNPLTNVKNIKKLTETELKLNISGKASWHYQYKDSAWVFIGGLPYDLSEGDIIAIFSQYGEVVNLNLVRDKVTGKSKGFCFLCYEDQRSTILAVDNLNSIKVCGRTLRVDHVEQYKVPKNIDKLDEEALQIIQEGCGPDSNVLKTMTNDARALSSAEPSLIGNSEPNEAPMVIQPMKIEEPPASKKELKVPKTKHKSKKKSRSRSPKHKKSSDRRHSPTIDRKPSPSREQIPSPSRERRSSPSRKPRDSPSRRRRDSPSRERRHSPSRKRRQSPNNERRRSPYRERNYSPDKERSKREKERHYRH